MPINNAAELRSPFDWTQQAIKHYRAGREKLEVWLQDHRDGRDRTLYEESAAEIHAAIAAASIAQALDMWPQPAPE
jgi:hypothetical protein